MAVAPHWFFFPIHTKLLVMRRYTIQQAGYQYITTEQLEIIIKCEMENHTHNLSN